ncbi:MAG: esterase [Burkholderiales bacterium]|nr:esterase [Burkholderiales bacterium]
MPASIIVAQPEGHAEQLMLLFHGVGSDAQDLVPLGQQLAVAFPRAWIVSVQAREPSDFGHGYQWFSVNGVTEANRAERVALALPSFLETVQHWQNLAHVGVGQTALIGFSQGAIMALESTRDRTPVAGRVVSIAGRFAQLPRAPAAGTTLHFLHGKSDAVMPYGLTVAAAEHLVALGGDVTADVLPFLGHGINVELVELLIERLRGYIPRSLWRAALAADPGSKSGQGRNVLPGSDDSGP